VPAMTKPELSDEETPRTQLERFFSALQRLARTGDKALLRANAKTRGEIFRKAASPSDVASARRRLDAEVRRPQPIVPTDQREDQNRWVAVAGGALEGLGS
jgi:hypothetical protein